MCCTMALVSVFIFVISHDLWKFCQSSNLMNVSPSVSPSLIRVLTLIVDKCQRLKCTFTSLRFPFMRVWTCVCVVSVISVGIKITYQITYQTRPPQGKLAQPQESHRLK